MKNKKIALILSGILTFTLVCSGCGSKSAGSSGNKKDDNTISIMLPLISADAPAKDNDLEKKLEELTGYNVDITWVPNSSYADKISITMASDNVPDIIEAGGKDATSITNVQKGAFWKLDDYLKDYENLSQADPEISLNASFNGETYGIYRGRDVLRSCVIFRKDWLDKLGLQVPKTLDEFTNVLKAFKEKDPDGNGQDDTTGLIVPKWQGLNSNSPFDEMAIWFGAPNATKFDGDKVVPDFMTEENMTSLDYFKKLYDEGLMNQDFAVLDTEKWDDAFVNGTGGVIVDTQSRAASIAKKMKEKYGDDNQNGDSYVVIQDNITTDKADKILPTTGYSGLLMIPKQSVKNEERLKKVLDFIDKVNSEEVNTLLNNGIEGKHYTKEGDVYVPTTDNNLLNEIAAYSQLSCDVRGYTVMTKKTGSNLEKKREEIKANDLNKAVFNPCASLISKVYASKGAQLQNIMADARIQYIAGQIDKDGYKAAQEQWLSTGGQEYIDELTKLYKENIK